MPTRTAFVTGGAGFIGRAVVERCLRAGYDVTVYDNLCAGTLDNLLPFMERVTFHEADILDGAAVRSAMEAARPDVVFHLAAHHFIPFCNEHPQETLRVNVEGTHVVLQAAADAGARTAVVASSGAIYPSYEGVLEENMAPAPPDVYGLSKLLAEGVAEHVARTTSMSCVVARLFNTYGPYETNPHLIPHLIESLKQGPTIDLGNVKTKRDYIYVEDVADLLVAAAEAAAPGAVTINVGTGVEHSAEEIVEVLGRLLGERIEIRIDASRVRAVDKMHQRASTERLRSLTGTTPAYGLEQGLERLLRHEQLLAASHPTGAAST